MQRVFTPELVGNTLEEVLQMQMDFIPGGHWHLRIYKRNGAQLFELPPPGSIEAHPDRLNLEIEHQPERGAVVVGQIVG